MYAHNIDLYIMSVKNCEAKGTHPLASCTKGGKRSRRRVSTRKQRKKRGKKRSARSKSRRNRRK